MDGVTTIVLRAPSCTSDGAATSGTPLIAPLRSSFLPADRAWLASLDRSPGRWEPGPSLGAMPRRVGTCRARTPHPRRETDLYRSMAAGDGPMTGRKDREIARLPKPPTRSGRASGRIRESPGEPSAPRRLTLAGVRAWLARPARRVDEPGQLAASCAFSTQCVECMAVAVVGWQVGIGDTRGRASATRARPVGVAAVDTGFGSDRSGRHRGGGRGRERDVDHLRARGLVTEHEWGAASLSARV